MCVRSRLAWPEVSVSCGASGEPSWQGSCEGPDALVCARQQRAGPVAWSGRGGLVGILLLGESQRRRLNTFDEVTQPYLACLAQTVSVVSPAPRSMWTRTSGILVLPSSSMFVITRPRYACLRNSKVPSPCLLLCLRASYTCTVSFSLLIVLGLFHIESESSYVKGRRRNAPGLR